MEILIYILIVNALLAFKLWWDYRAKNVKHRIINHGLSALIDGILYCISAWFLFGIEGIGWVVIAVWYRWQFFDPIFNLLNGDKWNHYGNSAWQDRQLKKLGKWHLAPKIAILIIGIIVLWKQRYGF